MNDVREKLKQNLRKKRSFGGGGMASNNLDLAGLEEIKRRCAGCKYFSYSKIGLMEFYHCLAYPWPLRYVLAIVERDRKGKIVKVEVSDWPEACIMK